MNAVKIFTEKSEYYNLRVPQFAIASAVRALVRAHHKLDALKLIRSAYKDEGDRWASLKDAQTILALICK